MILSDSKVRWWFPIIRKFCATNALYTIQPHNATFLLLDRAMRLKSRGGADSPKSPVTQSPMRR